MKGGLLWLIFKKTKSEESSLWRMNVTYLFLSHKVFRKLKLGSVTSVPLDLFQPKMSPTLSFSSMYQKSFIYRRNRTNSQ